ncbi:baseplate J/gp47 family protein [Weissella muntiaci]|uniref:Baseplate J/gp47 family protein n=1 Tax=Weissella muntiaci TaxID=2508881 RepID=A0A6C2C7Q0_9LACO|nr:baseplate J/gp47 family protein [Weissella muntiaci]TYC49887.1 baseplate J/gp47 family protein [Weissella muntiaci]
MLDSSGLKRRRRDEILNDMIAQAQSTISTDVAVGPDSMVGMFLRVVASELAKQEELQESVWFSGFVSQATGISLDRLAGNIGLYRNPAKNATTNLTLKGKAGTKINEQTLFGTQSGINFFAAESGELQPVGVATSDGEDVPGELEILVVSVEQNLKTNVAAGRINKIVEAVDGLTEVVNKEAAVGGVALESDSDLRTRLLDNYRRSANGTPNALITAVENVVGVQMAHLIVNDTMEVDSNGNPPKSVHFYVQGGDDYDIANAIFNAVAAGVSTTGASEVEVPLINGTHKQVIKFDRPTQKAVDVQLTLVVSDSFSISGKDNVKANVTDYLTKLTIGETLHVTKLYGIIYEEDGIVDVDVKLTVDGRPVTGNKVTVEEFEYLSPGDIEVTV